MSLGTSTMTYSNRHLLQASYAIILQCTCRNTEKGFQLMQELNSEPLGCEQSPLPLGTLGRML